jgi:hypothetical protein
MDFKFFCLQGTMMKSGCKNFRMRKKTLFDIVDQLEFLIHKQDKKY